MPNRWNSPRLKVVLQLIQGATRGIVRYQCRCHVYLAFSATPGWPTSAPFVFNSSGLLLSRAFSRRFSRKPNTPLAHNRAGWLALNSFGFSTPCWRRIRQYSARPVDPASREFRDWPEAFPAHGSRRQVLPASDNPALSSLCRVATSDDEAGPPSFPATTTQR